MTQRPPGSMQRGWSSWTLAGPKASNSNRKQRRTFPCATGSVAQSGFRFGFEFFFLKCWPKYCIHSIYPKPCQRILLRKSEIPYHNERTLNMSLLHHSKTLQINQFSFFLALAQALACIYSFMVHSKSLSLVITTFTDMPFLQLLQTKKRQVWCPFI